MDTVDSLSRSLLQVHRSLLKYQKLIQEGVDKKVYTPHEVLNFALNSPDFEWLRQISSLIVRIDEDSDNKNVDRVELLVRAKVEIRNVLKMFDERIVEALSKDSNLWNELADLKKRLED